MVVRRALLLVIAIIGLLGVIFFIQRNTQKTTGQTLHEENRSTNPDTITSGQTASVFTVSSEIEHLGVTATNIIWYTNQYRIEQGLEPLNAHGKLRRSARGKNKDMIEYQYFAHHRPSGFGFERFIDAEEYEFIKIGENLAMGDFSTSKEVVDAWMKSPEHRNNILDAAYVEIGVSVDQGVMFGKETLLITQHFARPKSSCPLVSVSLKKKINDINMQLISLKQGIEEKKSLLLNEQNDIIANQIITDHNELIVRYNNLSEELDVVVKQYNEQVSSFERCVQESGT